jgi:GntR family transcriptional regulator
VPEPASPSQYAQVAAALREEILGGRLPPGIALPSETRLAAQRGVSKTVLRNALRVLRSEGLITTVKGGSSYVRDRRAVRLAVSRYSRTFHPGLPAPFQAAAHESGLVGSVRVIQVERRHADADTAAKLALAEGEEVVVCVRHMMLGEAEPETVQVSTSVIPGALVEGSALAGEARIPSGVFAAFAALGHIPTTMTEEVSARAPTPEEATTLGLVPGQGVLVVERVTSDQEGRPIELVRVVATADRTVLVYDGLPIAPAGT